MNATRLRLFTITIAALALAGCSGRGTQTSMLPATGSNAPSSALQAMSRMPQSISPGKISAPPMQRTALQSATSMSSLKPAEAIEPVAFTQIPGAGVFIAASPDGSVWVLSTQGVATGDKYIYHYQNGTWTNVPGALSRIAVAPDATLWGINAAGSIYHLVNGTFLPIAGGASDLSVGADGSLYVISSINGGQYGNGIYKYTNGTWTQLPGAGIRIAASWDTGSYNYNVAPGGFYVVNAQLSLFYWNPTLSFTQIPGAAIQLAPTTNGGLFALGVPTSSVGNPIYYNDLSTGTWTQQSGAGIAIATNTTDVYVIGANDGIYYAPVVPVSPPGGGSPLEGPSYYPSNPNSCSNASNENCLWAATSLANALKYPVQSGYNGNGQTVAIVIDSSYWPQDLTAYLNFNQTPSTNRSISTQLLSGASGTPTNSGDFEASLDLETIAGLAPGANVENIVVPSLGTQNLNTALNTIITQGVAHVVSMSFGGCEYSGFGGEPAIFQTGANDGIAFVASSGDQGNECFNGTVNNQNTYAQGVSYPASDPNVIGVGGTQSYTQNAPLNSLTTNVSWNDTTFALAGGQWVSGGGTSRYFAKPTYQGSLGFSPQYRNVPDVAMPAIGTLVYSGNGGGAGGGEGTSWAAPLFAAMLTEVFQYCNTSFTNPVSIPYYVYSNAGYNAFIDVTSGNNNYQNLSSYYVTGPGYDNVTGIGVPYGIPFANAICPNRVPAAAAHYSGAVTAQFTRRAALAIAVDVVPHLLGLVDNGRRSGSASTAIQIVLQPGTTIASDEQSVIGVLQAAGFQITQTFSNHLIVNAVGASSAVEQLFSTQMHDETQERYGRRYMPVTTVTLPASLAPYVAGLSLDNVVNATRL